MRTIYLDNNASTPVDPRVVSAVTEAMQEYGANPSSAHGEGKKAAAALERARDSLLRSLHCGSQYTAVITSTATEALNIGIRGLRPRRVIVGATEHKAILEICRHLERESGCVISVLPVDSAGRVRLDVLEKELTEPASVVIVQWANNETGVVQPIEAVVRLAHYHGVPVLCDAVQAIGKISVALDALPVDLLVIAGHKIYGPRSSGALYIRRDTLAGQVGPVLYGGGQELGLRPGSESVPDAIGLAEALKIAVAELVPDLALMRDCRDKWEASLAHCDVLVNAAGVERLGNTSSACLLSCDVSQALEKVPELSIATGSACTSDDPSPSHVLMAMGLPERLASNAIRVSFGRFSSSAEALYASECFSDVLADLKRRGAF